MLSFVICGIGDVCPASVNLSKWISSIIYLVSVYVLWRRMCCVCVCERRQFVAICFHVEHQKRHMMEWNEIICLWRLINMSVVYAMKLRNYALEWEWNKFGVAVIVCFFFLFYPYWKSCSVNSIQKSITFHHQTENFPKPNQTINLCYDIL